MVKRLFLKSIAAFATTLIATASVQAQTAIITVNSNAINSGDTVEACIGVPTLFDVNHSGFSGPFAYAWSFQNAVPAASTAKTAYALFSAVGYKSVTVSVFGADTASSEIVVYVLSSVQPGTTTGVQTICNNTTAAALTRTNASGGTGNFTYEWQYAIGSTANWINSGQSGLTYSPIFSLTLSTWFRVKVTASCGVFFTNDVLVTVHPPLTAGILSVGTSNFICPGSSAQIYLNFTMGGNSIHTETLQKRSVGASAWQNVAISKVGNSFTIPNVTESTEFRVSIFSCGQTEITNTIVVSVPTPIVLGSIQHTSGGYVCYGYQPAPIYVPYTGGSQNVTFNWYRKVGTSGWQSVSGWEDTLHIYGVQYQTTLYRCEAKSITNTGYCSSVLSDTLTLTSLIPISGWSTLSQSQNICYGTQPTTLVKGPVGGAGNSFTYQWQVSTTGTSGWQNFNNASLSFQPGVLYASRWYRVLTYAQFCNDTFYSNIAHINVYPQFVPGTVQPDTTYLCNGYSVNLQLSGSSGGAGNTTHVWEYRLAGALTWVNYPGAGNSNTLTVSNLPPKGYEIRVKVLNACNSVATSNIAYVNIASTVKGGQLVTASGVNQACTGMPAPLLRLTGYGGGIGPFSFSWQKRIGLNSYYPISGSADSLQDFLPITQPTAYRVLVTDLSGCGNAYSDSITITPGIALNNTISVDGASKVCKGTQNEYYSLQPGFVDSVHWQITNGTIVNNGADRVLVNFANSFVGVHDTLYATLYQRQKGCEEVLKWPIQLNPNIAPQAFALTYLAASNTLVYADSLSGFTFSWGTLERATGFETIFGNSNSHRLVLGAPLDTLNYNYFIRVTNSVCHTTVLYNGASQPFAINEALLQGGFSLYPNPNNGRFALEGPLNDVVAAHVANMLGTTFMLEVSTLKDGIVLPQGLPAGYYVLNLATQNGVARIPFTIINY